VSGIEIIEMRKEWQKLSELVKKQNVLLGTDECKQVLELIDFITAYIIDRNSK
jgi:hypothetical protein